ncbi:SHOCT domain-containing protein [Nitrosopumilus sp.]|nr:SHOCT domain-containing protein [Nitrosopumilus sp.]
MGSFCHTCKKKLGWGQKKYTHSDIISAHPTVVPVGFTSEDILCGDCIENLVKQVPVSVSKDEPGGGRFSEYDTEKQKDCSLVRDSDEICAVYFEISSIKLNGEFIDQNLFSLSSECPNFYQFLIWKKSKFRKEAELFCRFLFGTPPSEWDTSTWTEDDGSFDKFLTFQFDSKTGKLIIVTNGISKNVNRFEIQLKFQNQALILSRFLLFTNLRKKKINDKTIKEIKLKNNSKKIKLEKNSNELHEHEEVLAEFFKSNRTRYNNDSQIITDYVIFRITNFKIINDVWYTPLCFIQNNNDVSEKSKEDIMNDIQENSIFNFTHDEYDDVIASNVKQTTSSTGFRTGGVNAVSVYGFGVNQDTHSYQGTATGNESGDIIFMSKGKKLCTWENFVDPKGIVDMIKSAKSQFESQDGKIPEPVISSSDDDPLKILKIRLAKGEITLEEFNEIKENLV